MEPFNRDGLQRGLPRAGQRAGHADSVSSAASHDFWERGRFVATYRATFGETPTDTLRRRFP
jgi:hypothetical protein